jgi:plastocyanin
MKRARTLTLATLTLAVLGAPLVAAATPSAPTPPLSPEQMTAELARLQAEVRDQRALVMQLVRVEQEHYDLLLRLIQGRGPTDALPPAGGKATAPAQTPAGVGPDLGPEHGGRHAAPRTSSLHGKVEFPGGSLKDIYVYIENVKGPGAHGKTAEIAQRDKQFVPEVLVVQRGTRVSFPNYDSVFHNVFSPTTPHPFDLGSYRAGEPAKSVELTSPGIVDIFCNVHSRMRASVLVVPTALFTRVGADGTFQLEGVPLGTRKVVVWGPRSKPASQTVDVGPSGGDLTLTLQPRAETAHNNKLGQPYSNYKD